MENLRKSKRIALDLLENTRDVCEVSDNHFQVNRESPVLDIDSDAGPSTSADKPKRPTEFVKYGKITFNTTAILHHYPQIENKNSIDFQPKQVATKKSDLNLPVAETRMDNNNDVRSENKETKVTIAEDSDNGNTEDSAKATAVSNCIVTSDNAKVNCVVNADNAKVNCVVNADNTIEVLKKPVKFTEEKLV